MGLLAAKFSVSGQLCEERTLDWGATLDERSSLGSQADIHCSQTGHSKAALKTAEKSQTLPIAVRMKVSAFSQLLWSFGRLRRGRKQPVCSFITEQTGRSGGGKRKVGYVTVDIENEYLD